LPWSEDIKVAQLFPGGKVIEYAHQIKPAPPVTRYLAVVILSPSHMLIHVKNILIILYMAVLINRRYLVMPSCFSSMNRDPDLFSNLLGSGYLTMIAYRVVSM